tara:strand:- start:110 stop:976 length:867 start_codon:yes stop_codon:yes gene_type:complete
MSVYLGTTGEIELQRQFDGGELQSTILSSDVNVTAKRFSFDFEHGQLISGDQVQITSTDGTALDFIDSYTSTSVTKFIHVDELDGIRLYNSFADAINGGTANAIALALPGNALPIRVKVENSDYKILAQVNNFELNTERETVDTTTLSDEFRSRISTLMSGSGRISCFWEYTGDAINELPNYLVELSLRTRVGSQFKARFYIKTAGNSGGGGIDTRDDEIYYEFSGVLTACAVQFNPTETVQIQADFISTGPIQLRANFAVGAKLLQEDLDEILLDQDATDALLLEQP